MTNCSRTDSARLPFEAQDKQDAGTTLGWARNQKEKSAKMSWRFFT
jgi:hypothetical protein